MMKIAICYPPFDSAQGKPLLSQNRQFQWFRSPVTSYTIYPIVPAYAATLLKKQGNDVTWLDYIAEGKTHEELVEELIINPQDLMAFETKTPTVKRIWKIINDLKKRFPKTKFVLMGDHVTAMPEESLKNSNVDYVITGGDYDFALSNLTKSIKGEDKLHPGVYWKKNGKVQTTGKFILENDLNQLPIIDRELTKWWLYARGNGNFKYAPNTYTMVGRDCWWRRQSKGGQGCTFCSWTSIFPKWRTQKPEKLLDEVGYLIDLGVKEIFDDTGTFPVGEWLHTFCDGIIKREYNKKVVFGCNMRANILKEEDYKLMGKANFRFVLYGLESANQKTIDRLNKGTTIQGLTDTVRLAKKYGMEPHITCMFGYPWETKKEAENTVNLAKNLFKKGYINTLQATIVIPYPGTALFKECEEKKWLKTRNWDRYDMSEPIMKSFLTDRDVKELVQKCYSSFVSVDFFLNTLRSIKSWADLKHLVFVGFKYVSKLLDFQPLHYRQKRLIA